LKEPQISIIYPFFLWVHTEHKQYFLYWIFLLDHRFQHHLGVNGKHFIWEADWDIWAIDIKTLPLLADHASKNLYRLTDYTHKISNPSSCDRAYITDYISILPILDPSPIDLDHWLFRFGFITFKAHIEIHQDCLLRINYFIWTASTIGNIDPIHFIAPGTTENSLSHSIFCRHRNISKYTFWGDR